MYVAGPEFLSQYEVICEVLIIPIGGSKSHRDVYFPKYNPIQVLCHVLTRRPDSCQNSFIHLSDRIPEWYRMGTSKIMPAAILKKTALKDFLILQKKTHQRCIHFFGSSTRCPLLVFFMDLYAASACGQANAIGRSEPCRSWPSSLTEGPEVVEVAAVELHTSHLQRAWYHASDCHRKVPGSETETLLQNVPTVVAKHVDYRVVVIHSHGQLQPNMFVLKRPWPWRPASHNYSYYSDYMWRGALTHPTGAAPTQVLPLQFHGRQVLSHERSRIFQPLWNVMYHMTICSKGDTTNL